MQGSPGATGLSGPTGAPGQSGEPGGQGPNGNDVTSHKQHLLQPHCYSYKGR